MYSKQDCPEKLNRYWKILSRNPAIKTGTVSALKRCAQLTDADLLYLGVFMPALVEYVEWVLTNAKTDGIRRLYFLARDAWPMYQVAQRLCKDNPKYSIECRYLKVSRFSLRVPEYHMTGKNCLDFICGGGIRVTPEKILRRAGLDSDEIELVSQSLNMRENLRNELLSPEILRFKKMLSEDNLFMELVMRHSRAAYPAAMDYLEQEGLLDNISYAIVDSGWIGTLQSTLQHLLQSRKTGVRITGYYFGLYETPPDMAACQYHCFYFSPAEHLKRKVLFSNCLFETVFSAPDGMTIRYEKRGSVYEAVEDQRKNFNRQRILRNDFLLSLFMDGYRRDTRSHTLCCRRLFRTLMGTPEPWEVSAIGTLLFCDDVLEDTVQPVAAPLSVQEIKCLHIMRKFLIVSGITKGPIHESAWIEGTIVRNGYHVKRELLHARIYKYTTYLRKLWKWKRTRPSASTFLL